MSSPPPNNESFRQHGDGVLTALFSPPSWHCIGFFLFTLNESIVFATLLVAIVRFRFWHLGILFSSLRSARVDTQNPRLLMITLLASS